MPNKIINDVKIISSSGVLTADIGAKIENVTLSSPIVIDDVTCSTLEEVLNTLNTKKINISIKGSSNGLAELDSTGKVPISQLPATMSRLEKYPTRADFPVVGDDNTLYVALDTNYTYRWTGAGYVQIDESIQLGETASTAYRGDRGKIAYDHSQVTTGNPHNVTKSDVGLGNVGNFKAVSTAASQGLTTTEQTNARTNIGLNNVGNFKAVSTEASQGLSTTEQANAKTNIGLDNVGNFKAVSTVANQGLTDIEKSNARTNIGAGTSNFSGSYNDLTNKPTIPTVNNATLTIQKNGTNVGTFTANASSAKTINITVSKSDVGLGNVGNFKAVSTVASQGLTTTEQTNARKNIGAVTASFNGSALKLSF